MSKNINPQEIEDQTLSYLDAKYLRDRGRLPKDYPMPDPPENGGERAAKPSKVTPLEQQSVPVISANGGIVPDDEVEEGYTEGWNNPQRRAELFKRGLSVEGKMDDLIARLRRSDLGELIEGDESEHEDTISDEVDPLDEEEPDEEPDEDD